MQRLVSFLIPCLHPSVCRLSKSTQLEATLIYSRALTSNPPEMSHSVSGLTGSESRPQLGYEVELRRAGKRQTMVVEI